MNTDCISCCRNGKSKTGNKSAIGQHSSQKNSSQRDTGATDEYDEYQKPSQSSNTAISYTKLRHEKGQDTSVNKENSGEDRLSDNIHMTATPDGPDGKHNGTMENMYAKVDKNRHTDEKTDIKDIANKQDEDVIMYENDDIYTVP